MKSFSATSQYTCVSNAVATLPLLLILLLSSSTNACSTYCDPSTTTFGTNIAQADVIAVAYLWKDISPPIEIPSLPWQTNFYQAYVSSVYKGDEKLGNGEIIVRSVGICDSLPVHQHVVVFGDIVYQTVEGFATPMPVLQPNACTASGRPWSALSTVQQNRLEALDPQEDPCEQQDCDELPEVPYPPVFCGDGNTVQPHSHSCKLGSSSNMCEPDIFFPACP